MSVEISQVLYGIFEIILVTVQTIILKIIKFFTSKRPKNISGQLALITGSAQGLGRELAKRLAAEGCNLALVDINYEKNKIVAQEIIDIYPKIKVKAFHVDVSKIEEIQKLKDEIKNELGSVDILINNAAILDFENSIMEGHAEDYQRVIEVNLMSHFWTIRTFLPDMIKNRRGHIVALSSFGSKFPYAFTCLYTASKAGVNGLMNSLREEFHYANLSDFIKTTTVYPNLINSETLLAHQKVEMRGNDDGPLTRPARNEPFMIADEIVRKGILLDKEEMTLPKLEAAALSVLMRIPFEIRKVFWKIVTMTLYDEYLKRRIKIYDQMGTRNGMHKTE